MIKFYSIEAIYSINIESNNKLKIYQKKMQFSLYAASKEITI